jgi:hypothetical protein
MPQADGLVGNACCDWTSWKQSFASLWHMNRAVRTYGEVYGIRRVASEASDVAEWEVGFELCCAFERDMGADFEVFKLGQRLQMKYSVISYRSAIAQDFRTAAGQ